MKNAASVALLYQRTEGTRTIQKVISVIVEVEDGDDGRDHKANAERYVDASEKLREAVKGMSVACWDTATPADGYELLFGESVA